jgi:hypothetical protein
MYYYYYYYYNLSQYAVEGGPFAGIFIPALGHERQTLCGSYVHTEQWPAERRGVSQPLHYLCTQTERETDRYRERLRQTDRLAWGVGLSFYEEFPS